ncbi:MAG: hypothetical protein CMH32_06075 [Micavibrio sp.]|nr:hypothetical protein [Micavibrio sp.]HCK32916.1 hypothetical protein [Rhodospirillaceae bacterium]|tara:strand:+ start:1300 stop:1566 length:267 start_codon:yes stop_codon:yes gene_type:complete
MLDLFDYKASPSRLHVRVTPKAKSARIKKEITEGGGTLYKVYVTVVPEDGKANKAVIALLSKALGVPKSALTITHGLTSRDKIIEISR